MLDFKALLRRMVSRFFVATGVTALGRTLFPVSGTIVLYGHRVARDDEGFLQGLHPEWLDQQVAYLARHFEIISLSQLVHCLEQGCPAPRKSVVLTFDDGFRDNLENAMPILERHGATATVFLTTGAVESGQLPWSQRLGVLFQRTTVTELSHSLTGNIPVALGSARERRLAYDGVKRRMRRLAALERERILEELAERLGVVPPGDRMLSWDDARELQARGWEMGAHTWSHTLLAEVPLSEARLEMERSRDDLEERLGVTRPVFCFPAGSLAPGLVALARELGFGGTFQPDPARRPNRPEDTDPFSMRRIGMPNAPAVELEAELDGPMKSLRSIMGRMSMRGRD